jgi:hypothetical protein
LRSHAERGTLTHRHCSQRSIPACDRGRTREVEKAGVWVLTRDRFMNGGGLSHHRESLCRPQGSSLRSLRRRR